MSSTLRSSSLVGTSILTAMGAVGCCFGGTPATPPVEIPGVLSPTTPTSPTAVPTVAAGGAGVQQGALAAGDSQLQSGEFQDTYTLSFPVGSPVMIRAESTEFDTYLIVHPPAGEQLDNDDYNGDRNARVDIPSAQAGAYRILVTSFAPGETGNYTLTTTPAGTP